jgi:hypothetical protein
MSVVERINQQLIVLAIQDTTDLDFTSYPQTSGLGFINQGKQQGIEVYSCIGVSEDGEPLGSIPFQHFSSLLLLQISHRLSTLLLRHPSYPVNLLIDALVRLDYRHRSLFRRKSIRQYRA